MTVTVPIWALVYVMNHADLNDEGPPGEGWKSEEMQATVDTLENALIALEQNFPVEFVNLGIKK